MSGQPKLTRALRAMLERVKDGTDSNGSQMVLTIVASGGREKEKLQRLIRAGLVEWCDHQLRNRAVDGVRITDAGKAALALLEPRLRRKEEGAP